MFILMIFALVFLLSACFAWAVAHSFSSMHSEKLGTPGINRGNGANAFGHASVVKNAYTAFGAAQKRRFIVVQAGDGCIWAQQHRWKRSSIRD